jgi:PAS domain S-box-containing protein
MLPSPVDTELASAVLLRAIDDAPDGILVVDRDGVIAFANPRAEALFEYTHGDLKGRNVDELVPNSLRGSHGAHRASYMEHPRTRAMGSGLDLHGQTAKGEEFPVEISLSPVGPNAEQGVVAIVRDVTDRRAAEAELQRAFSELALIDDRERIARDLHDTVIQRLFAIGLSLQAGLGRTEDDGTRVRLTLAIDEIDATIHDLRSAIFSLHSRRPTGSGARDEVLALVNEMARTLGFHPSVRFEGLVDTEITPNLRDELIASLREALTNVAKHAHASRVQISLAVADDIAFTVVDDGVGIPEQPKAGHGLGNMRSRSEALGGTCEIRPVESGGTRVAWRVPRPS